ncbi:MAG TPA: hypothetical protein VHC69_20430 [Polyangiaceae bacterium]|nr:hypothetical protein [Polyangiaceae bacterium]
MKELHVWLLSAAALLAMTAEAVHRLFALYIAPAAAPGLGAVAIFGGALTGAAVAGSSRRFPARLVPWQLLALAAALIAASFVPFVAFDRGAWGVRAALACAAATAALSTSAALSAAGVLGRHALSLGFVPYVLAPARAAATLAFVVLVEVASSRVGNLRAGPMLALATIALAASYPAAYASLYEGGLPGARALAPASALVASVALAGLIFAGRLLPARELRRFPDEVVFAESTDESDYTVVASPSGYELFRDGQLAASSLDAERRATALAAPALATASARRRVLLLDGGFGIVERRLLADPRVEELTVVCPDVERLGLARRLSFVSGRAQGALDSSRVRTVIAEPLVFLAGHPGDAYDVVVADFPWPLGYREGKLYTRYAFERLSDHLAPDGVLVVPGGSAFTAKGALADVVATLASIGLYTTPYHVPVPTLGLASFVVASRRPLDAEAIVAAAPGADVGTDLIPAQPGHVATLHSQTVVTAFDRLRDR